MGRRHPGGPGTRATEQHYWITLAVLALPDARVEIGRQASVTRVTPLLQITGRLSSVRQSAGSALDSGPTT
jgi:hypothetical protein